MKILHTSDWHLGRTLYSKKERHDEHAAFLNWLIQTIQDNSIELLIIAGDIFDTAAPNSTSQKMYYDFLINVKTIGCDNIVVIGGNHDSPSFLNAPKDILAALNVIVVGNSTDNIENEIILIKDKNNAPAVIVCAVPFLRERDISRFTEGENYTDRSNRINENIKKHYENIAEKAKELRKTLGVQIPIIATGHMSVAGGKRNDDDGVRETYIGNIEAVGSDIFPDIFDYVALGHYHIPSKIKEHIRYCGSPIPMGFGEAGQKKLIHIIDFNTTNSIQTIEIPTFQKLESIKGDKNFIQEKMDALKKENISVWIEIIYNGNEIFPDLAKWVNEQVQNSNIEILKIQNRQFIDQMLTSSDTTDSLENINSLDVFDKLLQKYEIADEQKEQLKLAYNEIVNSINIGE